MKRRNANTSTHALMQAETELLRGDQASISIVYRNLTGQNPISPGYLDMMSQELQITIDPTKLSIKEL